MRKYLLLTQKKDGTKIVNRVLENTLNGNIFIDYANSWCYSKLIQNQYIFIIKDNRSQRWIKRPILALYKISEKKDYTDHAINMSIPYARIDKNLKKAIDKENALKDYLNDIIKQNEIQIIIENNGLSGKNTYYKGDILIFNSLLPNRKPIAVIEHLSYIQNKNSIRFDQKDIYEDYKRTIEHRINYLLAYEKGDNDYGFVKIDKFNFKQILFKKYTQDIKRTSISVDRLKDYEIDIITYLKSKSKATGLERPEQINKYQQRYLTKV